MPDPVSVPITRNLVLIGGGHTHALVLREWAINPAAGVSVTVVNPQAKAPYTGMLPGFIAGHYDRSALDIDLVRLARRAGARLITDFATGIDVAGKQVSLAERPDIAYDTLSVDIGITTKLPMIAGAAQHAVSAKPLGPFADQWEAFLTRSKRDELTPQIAVIGGGVAGVELALAMAYRVRSEGFETGSVNLIEAKSEILRETGSAARRKLRRELYHYGINVITNARVKKITAYGVAFEAGLSDVQANFVVTATGARPYNWLSETGLTLHQGYIEVDERLRSVNTPGIFAAGDCAHMAFAPRPKAGVFAVRQAPVLLNNLRADLLGGKLQPYRPQKSYLKLISTGRESAITDKWGLAPKGKFIWRLKDKIDRDFMGQFQETP